MICLTCMCMQNSPYCPDCGKRTYDYKCECGNALGARQKFCEKCGKPAPEKPEAL